MMQVMISLALVAVACARSTQVRGSGPENKWCPPPDEQTIVKVDSLSPSLGAAVHGRLLAAYNGRSIGSAIVRRDTATIRADSLGGFTLPLTADTASLRIIGLGYTRLDYPIRPTPNATLWLSIRLARACVYLDQVKIGAPRTTP